MTLSPNIVLVMCPVCGTMCEYDKRDYLNVRCSECDALFPPPQHYRKVKKSKTKKRK